MARREVVAAEEPEKRASGSIRSRTGRDGPVTDDDEPRAGDVGDRREVLDLLLGGEPADVADDDLAVGRHRRGATRRCVVPGRIARRRRPGAQREALDAERFEAFERRGRGRERQGGAAVQAAEMPGEGRRGTGMP